MTDVLDPDAAVAAGAAFGQTALHAPWGGLVVAASRFVEYGWRATVLIVPGLFRVDLEPLQETLGVRMRGLGEHPSHFTADPDAWDGLRNPGSGPIGFNGAFEIPDAPLVMQAKVLIVADAETGGSHVVARAAVGAPADA